MLGQKNILNQSIYFQTAKYQLDSGSMRMLSDLVDSLKRYQSYKIFIRGNTDSEGDSIYNKKLSEQRVQATQQYFIRRGVLPKVFSISALGEAKPVADNATNEGKQKNRRVDIAIVYKRRAMVDSSQFLPYISELYRLLEIRPALFCIDPARDTVLRCKKGTVVYVKANSFKINKRCKSQCVILKIKEDFLKSEMIIDNLSTTSDGRILESQGMLSTQANDCNGKKLQLLKDKDLVIFMPTNKIVPNTGIFRGNRTPHDSIMNWTANNSSVLQNFTLKQLHLCAEFIPCAGVFDVIQCDCKFFSCRIKRLDNCINGIFKKCERYNNHIFRKNLIMCKLRKELLETSQQTDPEKKVKVNAKIKGIQTDIAALHKKYPNCKQMREAPSYSYEPIPEECEKLNELYEKYGVSNFNALIYALNKELMDSFGVKTIEELKDTVKRKDLENVELSYMNKTISFEDYQYYVYNSSRLGWSNVDAFAEFPKDSLVNFRVKLKAARNVDCKIVFKKNRSILPPSDATEGHDFAFNSIPKGEAVWIIALKYEDGKPFLSMVDTTIDNNIIDFVFKELTLDELREQLRILDQ